MGVVSLESRAGLMEHSKLPWKIENFSEIMSGRDSICNIDGTGDKDGNITLEHDEANAEYIVKSANAYPGLVQALTDQCEILSHRYASRRLSVDEASQFTAAEELLRELGEL